MAISQHEHGSQTTSGTTEHVLNTTDPELTDGVFQFWLELNDMVDGDVLEFRIYEKVRQTGDTQRQLHVFRFADAQSDLIWASPTLILLWGWKISLKATAGTVTVPWSIRKVA